MSEGNKPTQLKRQGILLVKVKDQYPHLVYPDVKNDFFLLRKKTTLVIHKIMCFQTPDKAFMPDETFPRFTFWVEIFLFLKSYIANRFPVLCTK